MAKEVTDPAILAALESGSAREVTDPAVLAALNGGSVSQPAPMNGLESVLRGETSAVPFADKIVAAGTAGINHLFKTLSSDPSDQQLDDTYAGQVARQKEKLLQSGKDHKYLTTGGKFLGAGLSMAAPGAFASAAKDIGMAGRLATAGLNAGRYSALSTLGDTDNPMSGGALSGLENAAVAAPLGAAAGVGGQWLGEGVATLAPGAKVLRSAAESKAVKAMSRLPKSTAARLMENPDLASRAGRLVLDEGVLSPLANAADKEAALSLALGRTGKRMGDALDKANDYGFAHADNVVNQLEERLASLPPEASQGERSALQGYIDQLKRTYEANTRGMSDQALVPRTPTETAGTSGAVPSNAGTVTEPTPPDPTPLKGLIRPSEIHDRMTELGKRINWAKSTDPGAAQQLAGARSVWKSELANAIARGERAGFPNVSGELSNATADYQALSQLTDAARNAAIRESQAPATSLIDLGAAGLGQAAGGPVGAAAGYVGRKALGAYGDQAAALGMDRLAQLLESGVPRGALSRGLTSEEVQGLIDALRSANGPRLSIGVPSAAAEDQSR